MYRILKKYVSSYNPMYWVSIVIIILLALALYISSNISGAPTRQMTIDTISDSKEIRNILSDIEKDFVIYLGLLNEIAHYAEVETDEATWLSYVKDRLNVVMESYHSQRPLESGYFLNIEDPLSSRPLLQTYTNKETSDTSHISVLMNNSFIHAPDGLDHRLRGRSEPIFISIPNDLTKKFALAYAVPLYVNNEYRGFFGVTIDMQSLQNLFEEKKTHSSETTLLTSNLEIIASTADFPIGARLEGIESAAFAPLATTIRNTSGDIDTGYLRLHHDGKAWMNIFVRLPSGQVFLESFSLAERFAGTNMLISTLSVFAILCVWMVQKRESISPFDKLSGLVLNQGFLTDEQRISYKASFASHIGLLGAFFALFLYVLIGNTNHQQKIGYVIAFVMAASSVLLYRKINFTVWQRYIYLILCLLTPVVLHHLSGGFAAQNGSRIIPWCVITVPISSFLLNEKQNRGIFSLFVTVLFLDAVLEIVLIPGTNPEFVIRFMTVIFFLGFSLFVSTDLYVTGVQNLVKKLNEAYKQLQNAQSQIVKEEKMITLGRLIAGVAHEVNTPLGAIKASAEGIEASMQNAFMALINAHKTLTAEDTPYFFQLIDLTNASMADMYSSIQIRRAKPQILAYLTELGCEDPDQILQRLVRLEICNLDRIKENQDIFKNPNIMTLLSLMVSTVPIIKGSYIILDAAGRAYKIIFALKSYSHTNVSSDPVLFNLIQNIDNVLILIYNQIKQSVEVVRHYDEDVPELLGNPDELGQVWLNLMQNAISAMSGTGTMTITVQKEGHWLHVSVMDNGSGIAPESIPHIFEPFYTTKDKGEGSGLGLDICKKIVTEHQGRIEAESEPGVRTVFHVWLPVR